MAILKKGSKLETDLIATEKYVDVEVSEKIKEIGETTDKKISESISKVDGKIEEAKNSLEGKISSSGSEKVDKENGVMNKGSIYDSIIRRPHLEEFTEEVSSYFVPNGPRTMQLSNNSAKIHHLRLSNNSSTVFTFKVPEGNPSESGKSRTFTYFLHRDGGYIGGIEIYFDPIIKWLNGVKPINEDLQELENGESLFFIITRIGSYWYGSYGGVFKNDVE